MKFNIENRRYTGSKNKIKDKIKEIIQTECEGDSFFDVFGEVTLAEELFSIGKFDVSFSLNGQAGIGAHVGAVYDSNGLHLGSGASALLGFSWNLNIKYNDGEE